MKTLKFALILGMIGFVSGVVLHYVNLMTSDKIKEQLRKQKMLSLKKIFPAMQRAELIKGKYGEYYKIYDKKGIIGYAATGKCYGYSSNIVVMVGLTLEKKIKGVQVLAQNETPGLGTRITEVKSNYTLLDFLKGKKKNKSTTPWFLKQFEEKTVDEIKLGNGEKDIHAISGATISSRATVNAVREALKKILKEENSSEVKISFKKGAQNRKSCR